MKHLTSAFAAMSLLTMGVPAVPSAALAYTNSNADNGAVAFCKGDVAANFPDQPLGQCISINSASDNGVVPSVCKFAQAVEPDIFDYFYASFVDCVHDNASVFIG